MKKIILIVALGLLASCNQNPTMPSTSSVADSHAVTNEAKNSETQNQVQENSQDVMASSGHPSYGTSKHVLQVWADFQCPACQRTNKIMAPALEKLIEEGKLTVEYRQFPLTKIHKNAFGDAMAAMCANDQQKYKEFKDALYTLEEEKHGKDISDSDRVALAEKTGLNKDEFSSCLSSKKYSDYVNMSMKEGEKLGVTGTPTYILNGKKLDMAAFPTVAGFVEFIEKVNEKHN